jgi:hypothetical protein
MRLYIKLWTHCLVKTVLCIVYIVDNNNELTGFASEQAFLSLGYNFKDIIKLNIEDYIINGVIE